jgi:hypothetical protein
MDNAHIEYTIVETVITESDKCSSTKREITEGLGSARCSLGHSQGKRIDWTLRPCGLRTSGSGPHKTIGYLAFGDAMQLTLCWLCRVARLGRRRLMQLHLLILVSFRSWLCRVHGSQRCAGCAALPDSAAGGSCNCTC